MTWKKGPYGNFTLDEFVNFAEHLVKSSSKLSSSKAVPEKEAASVPFDEESPSFFQNGIGTAKTKTVSSTSASRKKATPSAGRNRQREKRSSNGTSPSLVPLDLSSYSKPSRLDVVLPEFIVDQVESYQNATKEVTESEEKRAEKHKTLEQQIQKAVEAMKMLQQSYQHLYEQISHAKSLFPINDPAHKSLDEILASAALPASIFPDELVPNLNDSDSQTPLS